MDEMDPKIQKKKIQKKKSISSLDLHEYALEQIYGLITLHLFLSFH